MEEKEEWMYKVINLLILTLSFIINLMYKSTFEQKLYHFICAFKKGSSLTPLLFLIIVTNFIWIVKYLPQVFLHNKRDWQRPQCPVLKRTQVVLVL